MGPRKGPPDLRTRSAAAQVGERRRLRGRRASDRGGENESECADCGHAESPPKSLISASLSVAGGFSTAPFAGVFGSDSASPLAFAAVATFLAPRLRTGRGGRFGSSTAGAVSGVGPRTAASRSLLPNRRGGRPGAESASGSPRRPLPPGSCGQVEAVARVPRSGARRSRLRRDVASRLWRHASSTALCRSMAGARSRPADLIGSARPDNRNHSEAESCAGRLIILHQPARGRSAFRSPPRHFGEQTAPLRTGLRRFEPGLFEHRSRRAGKAKSRAVRPAANASRLRPNCRVRRPNLLLSRRQSRVIASEIAKDGKTAQPSEWLVGDAGIELMAIAAWHPFKTRRRVADLVRETICRSECQSRSRANRRR